MLQPVLPSPGSRLGWVGGGTSTEELGAQGMWHQPVPYAFARIPASWQRHSLTSNNGSAFGGLLMAMALLGGCRMPAAVLLVAQACKSSVALLASQSPVIDPDKEEAAAEP